MRSDELSSKLATRFWARVSRRGPNECWPWTGSTVRQGRGTISVGGKTYTAPRVALALTFGRWLEKDEWALHRCDNPACCNPAHLWIGTAKENTLDAVAKKRLHNVSKDRCFRGHPLEGANLTLNNRGDRICLICRRARARKSQNRIRGNQERPSTQAKYQEMEACFAGTKID